MRTSVFLACLWSATAFAESDAPPAPPAPPPPQPTEVSAEVPEACKDLAKLATSPSKHAALSAKVSLATCLADHRTKSIVLCDCEQSVVDVNAAIDPSLALLDEVFVQGDAALKILARHAQGQMLASFATRMLTTVPPPSTSAAEAIALRDTRLAMLQPFVEPWQTRAQAAFREVDELARANPKLAKNAAVTTAVRSSRDKLAQGVVRR